MIRLIVADDHAIVRAGLLHVFSLLPDMQVVGEADGYAAIQRLLREVEVDVLLLDVSMPGISGVDCVSRLKHEFPGLRILNLTMHHNAELAKRLLDNGALGYVTKSADVSVLVEAIHAVHAGRRFCDPSLRGELDAIEQSSAPRSLTDREFEILRHLQAGEDLKTIGKHLCISPKTVSTHKMRIMEKLGARSNAELFQMDIPPRYAFEIIQPPRHFLADARLK